MNLSAGVYMPVRANGDLHSNYRTGMKLYASQKLAEKQARAGGSVYCIKLGADGVTVSLVHGPGVKLPDDGIVKAPTVVKRCEPIHDPPPSKAQWVCTGEWGHVGPCTRRLSRDYWGNVPK